LSHSGLTRFSVGLSVQWGIILGAKLKEGSEMQTFLPSINFTECARMLDDKRLGKQRVECLQILHCLVGRTQGWQNHPAVKMWRGYERCLAHYGLEICEEWIYGRFHRDTCSSQLKQLELYAEMHMNQPDIQRPPWLLDDYIAERVITSHRSNLLRKDPEHYGQFGWNIPNDLPYFWPVT
jgi:hypothetical protein